MENIKKKSDYVLVWRNKNGSSEDFDNILKPVPNSLKYQLFAKKTVNPFNDNEVKAIKKLLDF